MTKGYFIGDSRVPIGINIDTANSYCKLTTTSTTFGQQELINIHFYYIHIMEIFVIRLFLLIATCILTGCYTPAPIPFYLKNEESAQLRVSRISNVYIDPNSECWKQKGGVPLNINGGLSQLEKNNLIGMPKTNDNFTSFAHEYRIPAGKAITLSFDYGSDNQITKTSCGPIGATFTPEPGALYDAQMTFSNGYCYAVIRKLSPGTESTYTATVIKHKPAYKCSDL